MTNNECTECIHHPVCKTAESCDGYVSGCKHFNPGWISVKDRLPEKDGEYLVRFDNKAIHNAEYESKCGSFGYWLAIMWDEDADWFPYVGVTHWMPLPQPPKGE
jgi:hypothetical protein